MPGRAGIDHEPPLQPEEPHEPDPIECPECGKLMVFWKGAFTCDDGCDAYVEYEPDDGPDDDGSGEEWENDA